MSDKKIDPIECAATTLAMANHSRYEDDLSTSYQKIQKELTEQVKDVEQGDLGKIEAMLFSQAVVLQDIFSRNIMLLEKAPKCSDPVKYIQAFSQVALKAQNQCRNTLATLAEIKRPNRTIFVRQQTNAFNQQINACLKNELPEKNHANELLSCEKNHEALDFRGTPEAVRIDPPLETVESVHRGKNTRRKRALKNECA